MSDQVTLREYIERIIADHEKAHQTEHLTAASTAREVERQVEDQDAKNELRFRQQQDEISAIRDWQSKAIGALIVVTLLAGLFGAIVYHVLFGSP